VTFRQIANCLAFPGWGLLLLMISVANLIAIAIPVPTEMRHRNIARWLKSRLKL
jgi:hypothetical protein